MNKKNIKLSEQINWFTPYQENTFLEINKDTDNSLVGLVNCHFFIPHWEINIDNTEELKYIMAFPKWYEDNFNITTTDVILLNRPLNINKKAWIKI